MQLQILQLQLSSGTTSPRFAYTAKEYCNGKPWTRGPTLPRAYTGSSLAVAKWEDNRVRLQVYYQAPGFSLKEHYWDHYPWYTGWQYQPRESTKKVCNFCFWVELRIACVLAEQRAKLCRCKWRSGWISAGIVFGPLPDRTHLSAIIWDSVENIRVYYQAENGDIVEEYKDGSFRRVVSAVAVNS